MSTWPRANPKNQPLHCSAEWHLWRKGLSLGIYLRAGTLTNGGKNEFFTKRRTLANYFQSNYNATCEAFNFLVDNAWFVAVPNTPDHYFFVDHTSWATGKEDKCVERILLPYQEDADPLVGKLWAAAGGKFRLKEHWVRGLRGHGVTDEEILALFRDELATAAAKRANGDYAFTKPGHCFYALSTKLKQKTTV